MRAGDGAQRLHGLLLPGIKTAGGPHRQHTHVRAGRAVQTHVEHPGVTFSGRREAGRQPVRPCAELDLAENEPVAGAEHSGRRVAPRRPLDVGGLFGLEGGGGVRPVRVQPGR